MFYRLLKYCTETWDGNGQTRWSPQSFTRVSLWREIHYGVLTRVIWSPSMEHGYGWSRVAWGLLIQISCNWLVGQWAHGPNGLWYCSLDSEPLLQFMADSRAILFDRFPSCFHVFHEIVWRWLFQCLPDAKWTTAWLDGKVLKILSSCGHCSRWKVQLNQYFLGGRVKIITTNPFIGTVLVSSILNPKWSSTQISCQGWLKVDMLL